jgi:hypothetical protein
MEYVDRETAPSKIMASASSTGIASWIHGIPMEKHKKKAEMMNAHPRYGIS